MTYWSFLQLLLDHNPVGLQSPPMAQVVIVGTGPIGDAVVRQATLLGWESTTTTGVEESLGAVADLGATDGVIVLEHDHSVATPVLAAALVGGAGYVGALGSRPMQAARVIGRCATRAWATPTSRACTVPRASTSARTRRPRARSRSSPR